MHEYPTSAEFRKKARLTMEPWQIEDEIIRFDTVQLRRTIAGWLESARRMPWEVELPASLEGADWIATVRTAVAEVRVSVELQGRVNWPRGIHYLDVEARIFPMGTGAWTFIRHASDDSWEISESVVGGSPLTEDLFLEGVGRAIRTYRK